MKIKIVSLITLCVLITILFTVGCSPVPSVKASVDFGNPPEGGGACTGRGLCSVAPVNNDNTTTNSAISVTFKTSADKQMLIATFSLLELNQKQPQQAPLINPSTPTYQFDGEYLLSDPIFTPLQLLPGAKIDASCQSTVTINGDEVTMNIKYAHS